MTFLSDMKFNKNIQRENRFNQFLKLYIKKINKLRTSKFGSLKLFQSNVWLNVTMLFQKNCLQLFLLFTYQRKNVTQSVQTFRLTDERNFARNCFSYKMVSSFQILCNNLLLLIQTKKKNRKLIKSVKSIKLGQPIGTQH